MSPGRGRASILLIVLALCASTVQGADPGARYLGVHKLGVNRVSPPRRAGQVSIARRDEGLLIAGEARREPYYLRLSGSIQRIDARELVVQGELAGVPDMSWADEAPRARTTRGTFTFRVSKGRKFWRLYEVDGVPCVCDEGCGNDFCYIDIDLETTRAAPR
jgi:hypothetical protein